MNQIVVTAREYADLPAGGSYDISTIIIPVNNYRNITFKMGYLRGAGGGKVKYQISFCDDIEVFSPVWYALAEVEHASVGAVIEYFLSSAVTVAGKFIRIQMKESGVVGTPGKAYALIYMETGAE